MDDKIKRIIELGKLNTPEARAEMERLIEEVKEVPRIGSITSGGNVNIAKQIIINNGKKE